MSIHQSELFPGTGAEEGPQAGPTPRAVAEPDTPAGIAREARLRIGRNLRLLYAEVLDEPLPDRFGTLLADLAARTDPGGSS